MAKVLIAWPNRVADASYSGGGFTAAMPASYLATRQQSQVARSNSSLKNLTWFHIGASSAISAGVLALCNHNLTTAGQVRWRGFATDPRSAIYLDFSGTTLPAGVTLTRGSTAYYLDGNGLNPVQVAADTIRPSFDSSGRRRGMLFEGAATNSAIQCRDFTNAAWSVFAGSFTRTRNAVGIDGATNTATTLACTLANSILRQTVASLNSTQRCFSLWMRRVSGSGAVTISADAQSTSVTATLTSTWTRFFTQSAGATSTVDIKMATSGDVIEVDWAQLESGAVEPTSPILTTTVAVSRSADAVQYVGNGSIALAAGCAAMTLTQIAKGTFTVMTVRDTSSANFANVQIGASSTTANVISASASQASIVGGALATGSLSRIAVSWGLNDVRYAVNGTQGTPDTVATAPSNAIQFIDIGVSGAGAGAIAVESVKVYASGHANANLNSLTGTEGEIVAAYDSGLQDAWPAAYVAATTAEQRAGMRGLAIHTPSTPQTYQWWRCDMVDESNSAGYLQAGRVFMGTAWRPTYNMSAGAGIGYLERSAVTETYSGAEYFVDKPNPRSARFALDALTVAEGFGTILEMQRQLGTTRELLFSWNTDDMTNLPRHTFLGRFRSLGGLEMPYLDLTKTGIEIKELL